MAYTYTTTYNDDGQAVSATRNDYCNNDPINNVDPTGYAITTTISLKNYKGNNLIISFAKHISMTWSYSTKTQSIKLTNPSGLGCEIYIGASVGATLSILKSNVSKDGSRVKITNKCTMDFGKYKYGWSSSVSIDNLTVKYAFVVGYKSINLGFSVITKYQMSSNRSCYFLFDFGIKISQTLIKTAKALAKTSLSLARALA